MTLHDIVMGDEQPVMGDEQPVMGDEQPAIPSNGSRKLRGALKLLVKRWNHH